MQLRPFAPLTVVGAGLLIMGLATHSASADTGGAPVGLDVAAAPEGLLVTWQAPDGADGPDDYALVVTGPDGAPVLTRTVDSGRTEVPVDLADLHGATRLSVTVAAEYGSQRVPSGAVQVTLPEGPAKPETPPTVRTAGRKVTVLLPAAPEGTTGRIVQLYRDGVQWRAVSAAADKSSVTRRLGAGHRWSAAYKDVDAVAEGPLSEPSAEVVVRSLGPSAVRTVKLKAVHAGLRVHWSAATPQGADVREYRVAVSKGGARIGSGYAAAGVRSLVLPGTAADGVYTVTVTAKDAAGGTSTSSAAVPLKR